MLILSDTKIADDFAIACAAMLDRLADGHSLPETIEHEPTTGEALAFAMLGESVDPYSFMKSFASIRYCADGMSVVFDPERNVFNVVPPKRRHSVNF